MPGREKRVLHWIVVGCFTAFAATPQARGQDPAPTESASTRQARPPQPSPAQALGILFQAVNNIEDAVRTKELELVHNEDMLLYSALSILHQHSRLAPADKREALGNAITKLGRLVADLHAAADLGDQAKSDAQLQLVATSFDQLKTFYDRESIARAQFLARRYTCAAHPDVVGTKTSLCPKCGAGLDQVIRVPLFGAADAVCGAPGLNTVRAEIRLESPVQIGAPNQAILRLKKLNGEPVLLSDLRETHTQKIHLMLIDSGLGDYHHEHPVPTATPGEYFFQFTPQKSGPYRAWADVRTARTGFQEFALTDIAATTLGEPFTDKSVTLTRELDGLRLALSFSQPEIRARQPVSARLRVTQADGSPFTELEPVMGAFAHLVGFHENRKTILHIHPKGLPILRTEERGGPELEFQFFSPQPGFVRLFAELQVGGALKFIAFGVNVAAEKTAPE